MKKIYRVYCTNQDGNYEENGFYTTLKEAEIARDIEDRDKDCRKYKVTHDIEEIELRESYLSYMNVL